MVTTVTMAPIKHPLSDVCKHRGDNGERRHLVRQRPAHVIEITLA